MMSNKNETYDLFRHRHAIGREIELIRQELNIPVYIMCNTLGIDEPDYYKLINGKITPTVFQLICFIDFTRRPLKALIH